MNSQQKIINLLTICRKAGKLVIGFDAVKEAVYGGNASCVITASDISAKTLKEVKFFCNNSAVDVVYSGLDSDEFHGESIIADRGDHNLFPDGVVKFKSLGTVAGPHRGRKRKNGGNNSE